MVTIDATDSYGYDQDTFVKFYSADKKVTCKVDVHIRNTGPFKEDIHLTSSDPDIISFNENNKYSIHGEGDVTLNWMYGDQVKYSKDVKIIK